MNKKILICPSMLSADAADLGKSLKAVENAGADCIHWDIMDGNFVDAITFGAHVVAAHRKISKLRFDAHLMVENPDKHINAFANAGADSIIIHYEACKHLHKTLSRIKNLGKLSGLALNPATPADVIRYCLDVVDIILVMSVNPGASGQKFIRSQLGKIRHVREIVDDQEICVDGGIDNTIIQKCIESGATSFVTGSYLFKSKDYAATIKELRGASDE